MNDKERCSIGLKNKEICHKQTYVKTKDIKKVSSINDVEKDINDVEKDLIISRSGFEMNENTTVCLHHKYFYLKRYSTFHITCYDPFNSHNGKKKKKKKEGINN